MYCGYIGKLLFINLSDRTYEVRDLPEQIAHDFVGTHGLGARILYDEMPAHTPAFAPESVIGYVTGPVNAAGPLMGGRYAVVCKSPVYNGWNDSSCGGHMAQAIRRSGYDGIFVKGISETPVYVLIDNGTPVFRDATHLWGKTTSETEEILRKELGEKTIYAAEIGPAGENLSYMAAIMHEGHRAAGRGGSGAVMGSKKLKALVCRGNHKVPVHNVELVREKNRKTMELMKKAPIFNAYAAHGTGAFAVSHILGGDANVKNWTGAGIVDFPEELCEKIASQAIDAKYYDKPYGCDTCPVRCGASLNVSKGKWPMAHSSRPEWETIGAFGSSTLNSDADALLYCNQLCNDYGTDTLSTGQTISWAMECYDKGVLSREELDGIDLTWGNADAMAALCEKIVKNEGVGKKLLNGSREAARIFGKGEEFLTTSSGIEPPMHDARVAPAWARMYRVNPAPGRHTKHGYVTQGAPAEVRYNYDRGTGNEEFEAVIWSEIFKCSGYCSFLGFMGISHPERWDMVQAVTGFDYDFRETMLTGWRIHLQCVAFNMREGLRRKDFTIGERLLKSFGITRGPCANVDIPIERLVDNYYEGLGMDMNGVPTLTTLRMVGGLDHVIRDLYPDFKG